MTHPTKQPLDTLSCIEFSPVIWHPTTGDERLAALVGYVTGDGNIHAGTCKYARLDGESIYETLQASFYSNERKDLESILQDCIELGLTSSASVTQKKNTHPGRAHGWQVQLSKSAATVLIEAGAPVGKKTAAEFDIPKWVQAGSTGVKRAYIGALFGAEGTTPSQKSTNSKSGRQPTLLMCKKTGGSGSAYFLQLSQLLSDLGVRSLTTQSIAKDGYVTNTIRITSDSILKFYEEVSFVYAHKKAELAWLTSKYLRAVSAAASRRTKMVQEMVEAGEGPAAIGKDLGIARGGAYNLMQRVAAGESLTAGHGFPRFNEWLAPRWNQELGLLKLAVVAKSLRPEKSEVWNMRVSSPDHSYLLASGANNFNSFETMSGRVYYPFDRKVHVKPLRFDPERPIWIGQDFNIDPMSSVIFQKQSNGELWAVDEICLPSSNTQELCDELDRRFWRNLDQIVIYPDPAGAYRGHQRGESDLDIFRERGFRKQKYRRKHPAIADRVNAVNRMLCAADGTIRLYVDPRCKKLIEAFEQTLYLPGSREVDKGAGVEHAADAAGYCIEFEFPTRKVEVLGISI